MPGAYAEKDTLLPRNLVGDDNIMAQVAPPGTARTNHPGLSESSDVVS